MIKDYLFSGLILLIILITSIKVVAQPNCEAYKYYGDTLKYMACLKAEEKNGFYQFSRTFQDVLSEAITIDSTFAYAFREKSVAYLKGGDFINWKMLMDKAVKYDARDNLGYRGWCRYQFFRDYQGAIDDIEKLDQLVAYDIGYGVNGDYHLNVAKAISYRAMGQENKAIGIIEKQLKREDYEAGLFDYLHLGIWCYESNLLGQALDYLTKQLVQNDLAEVRYYLALTYKALDDLGNYKKQLAMSKKLYGEAQILSDPYNYHFDRIFLEDIENEMKTNNK